MNSAGDIVAIGAKFNTSDDGRNSSGHVRVYQYIDTPDGTDPKAWKQLGIDIDGEGSVDLSGIVSMNSTGDTVAIGAGNNAIDNAGHVRVWKYMDELGNPGTKKWQRLGQDIDGEAASDFSGTAVSMNSTGDIVSIGSVKNDGNGNNSGHVRIWKLIGSTWQRLGQDIDGETAEDQSGYSVSMNSEGTIIAVGAIYNDDNGDNSGHTRVFYYRNGVWNQATPGFFKVSTGFLKLSGDSFFKIQ
jgi:hypothetical protein